MYLVRVIRPSAHTRQPRSISPKTRFAGAWRSTCWESRSTSDHSNTSDKRHTTQPTHDRAYVFRDELPINVFIQRIRHLSSKCQKVYDIYIYRCQPATTRSVSPPFDTNAVVHVQIYICPWRWGEKKSWR